VDRQVLESQQLGEFIAVGDLNNKYDFSALEDIGKEHSVGYSKIKRFFSEGEKEVAKSFWIMLRKKSPHHKYNSVYYCPTCKKFDLEKQGQKIPW